MFCFLGLLDQRRGIKYRGISTVPWAFSPDTKLLLEELRFWKNLGVNTLRFNSWDNGYWFPISGDKNTPLYQNIEQNKEHFLDLVNIWTGDLNGIVVPTIFGVDYFTLELAREFYKKISIYEVTYEDIESLRIISVIYNRLKSEGRVTTTSTDNLYEDQFLRFERDMWGGVLSILQLFENVKNKNKVFFDIWNGAEAWQDVRHDWTIDKVIYHYSDVVGIIPPISVEEASRYMVQFENDIEAVLIKKGFKSLNRIGSLREHWYYGDRFPERNEIPSHTFQISHYSSPRKLLLTEIGVSRIMDRRDWRIVYKEPNTEGWKIMVDKVLEARPEMVCVHSFLDGRFRDLTYDNGSCRDLYNASGYERLASIKGYPHYDGVLHSILTSPSVRRNINRLGYRFTDKSELF